MEFIDKMNDALLAARVFPSAYKKACTCFDLMVKFTNTHGHIGYEKFGNSTGQTRGDILELFMDDLHVQTAPERKMLEAQKLQPTTAGGNGGAK